MSEKASVGIAMPTTGFRRFMFFNRFCVEREEGFVQIHFGLVNKANALVDSYSTAISELELVQLKGGLMDYLGRQGALLEAPPLWQAPAVTRVELANHLVMAHHGQIAETVLYSFSFWSAMEEAKKVLSAKAAKKEGGMDIGVMAEGMALLRSPLRAQQHLIRLLYPPTEPL